MATTTDTGHRPELREERKHEKRTLQFVGGGTTAEAIAGAGGIVLAILALAAVLPYYLMAISSIVLGGGLILKGGALAARAKELAHRTAHRKGERGAFVGGVSAEVLGGIAGVVLGILALIGIAPVTLCAIAVIVFGGVLLFGATTVEEFTDYEPYYYEHDFDSHHDRKVADSVVHSAAGAQGLIGMGAVALGILALLEIQPLTLTLVGFLCVGAALLLAGGAVGGRVMRMLAH